MEILLSPEEVRVLGSLIEKEITTPDYYPLTVNALINACNQKSSRDPVVSFDDQTVLRALDGLREKKLVRVVSSADSRVAKCRQIFTDTANLTQQELAVLCVLLLRGPQTAGELRSRTERLCSFGGLAEVESTLKQLMERETGALVIHLPRQPGFKESRYAHLLSGKVEELTVASQLEPAVLAAPIGNEKISRLEQEVESLRQEINQLRQQFIDFRKQFD